jgi:hypothetical protein
MEQYVQWSAALVAAGQGYLGATGAALAHAARMDADQGQAPGPLFRTLSDQLGGISAEPISDVQAAIGCMGEIWDDPRTVWYREPVTGLLLRNVIRQQDLGAVLRTLLAMTAGSLQESICVGSEDTSTRPLCSSINDN